jgi:hypothetical protein
MYTNRRKPIVSNKIPFCFAIGYVPFGNRIDVSFGEPEINHVDRLFDWWKPNNTVAKLDIAM